MKPFALWLCMAMTTFGALSGSYHYYLESNPRRVLVVVDASYPMQAAWPGVLRTLTQLQQRRYSRFSLYTEKGIVHGWSQRLQAGKMTAYAPRDLSRLPAVGGGGEIAEAHVRILISNASDAELGAFEDWTVIRPTP